MTESILSHESGIRASLFVGIFLAMAIWEVIAPCRRQERARAFRWPSNLAIVVLDTLVVRLLFRTAAVGVALIVSERGWGIMNVIPLPYPVAVVLSVVLLDLAIYAQHVLFHYVPAFWRVHRMHHADTEIDVTTGVRFHPIEIVLSILIKFAVIALLGAPALAVLVFEVLLNATSMFNHSNIQISNRWDVLLRWIIVTPDMHRVHHSTIEQETNSNFGFNLPWWDRLFRTYRAQPQLGHQGMTIGLEIFRDRTELRLDRMLSQPFRSEPSVQLSST